RRTDAELQVRALLGPSIGLTISELEREDDFWRDADRSLAFEDREVAGELLDRRKAVGRAGVRRIEKPRFQLPRGKHQRPEIVAFVVIPGGRRRVNAVPGADVRGDAVFEGERDVAVRLRDRPTGVLRNAAKEIRRREVEPRRDGVDLRS